MTEDTPIPVLANVDTASVAGTVMLERRGNVLTADAWFVPATPDAITGNARQAELALDQCSLQQAPLAVPAGTTLPSVVIDAPDSAALRVTSTLAPATRLRATSRAGDYLTLEPQRLGTTVVYATEANWIREPLPEDLSLAVIGQNDESLFAPVALRPVTDPSMLTPTDGRLDALTTAVRWTPPPAGADTQVRLTLHGWHTASNDSNEGTAVTLHCLLADDGEFSVPTEMQEEIGSGFDEWTVRLARERRTRITRDGSALEVVQLVRPNS